jgi:O-succinylbenzoate synthase
LSERLTLVEIDVPFRRPLHTAAGRMAGRRSVLVAVETPDSIGWGEAPAFPSGRFGTADEAFRDLAQPEEWSSAGPSTPIAHAALEAARADAAAQREGVPLHEWLGATGRSMAARHPIGLLDPERVPDEIAWLETHGISAIKLKIAPLRDVVPVAALRQALPDLDIGVDANASYRDPADPVFAELDAAGVSFIEQPFPPEALEAHRSLRSTVTMSVCVDEAITSEVEASRVIAANAADVLAVKLNRHGLSSFGRITAAAVEHGLGVRIGGTFDTAIGRLHLLAASGIPGVIDAAVGPPSAYLANDIAEYPTLEAGRVAPQPLPGIGTTPNDEALARVEVRRTTVELP